MISSTTLPRILHLATGRPLTLAQHEEAFATSDRVQRALESAGRVGHVRKQPLDETVRLRADLFVGNDLVQKPEPQQFRCFERFRDEKDALRGIDAEPFDAGFVGWGWEDVEWAMRVSRRHDILHVDIPATHLGLDPAPVMAAKFEQSAANFARVAAAHPQIVRTYPSYRAARMLKRAPLRDVWRPWLKAAALTTLAPVAARAFALRL